MLLLASQSLWSGSYVAMKFAGDEMPVGAVVVLRYGLVAVGYLLLLPFLGLPRFGGRDWLLIGGLGALNFTLSPTLQVASLRYTQSLDVAILVAFEPILTVVLARLVLREPLAGRTVGALILGVLGMLTLSGVGFPQAGLTAERLYGNMLFVGSMLTEVSVTLAGARLAKRYSPLQVMAVMKVMGFFTASLIYFPVMQALDLGGVSLKAWSSLAYLAFLASLFSYSVWYYVIREAPVNQVALSLFVQPIVGAALGYSLANERVGPYTFVGAAMILVSLGWWQWRTAQSVRAERRAPVP